MSLESLPFIVVLAVATLAALTVGIRLRTGRGDLARLGSMSARWLLQHRGSEGN